jgi:membrane protein
VNATGKIVNKLKRSYPVINKWEEWLKTFTLPGFDDVPVYDVFRFFVAEIRAHSLPMRSKSIAFSFFLAIFPGLTFVFTLIPFIPYFHDLDKYVLNLLQQVLPNKETYSFIAGFVEPLIKDVAQHKRGTLLTGSILLVIFLTSNGVLAMMASFDKTYDHYKKRNAIQGRLEAFRITFLLIVLFIFSLTLIILGQDLLTLMLKALHINNALTKLLFNTLRYLIIILMFFFGISLIYYYGPATKKKYKFISTGATVATILSILVSIGFSYWVNNFNKLNVIFGSIGTIMLLLIWLNINSFILLIGYEINASIHYNRTLKTNELDVKNVEESESDYLHVS